MPRTLVTPPKYGTDTSGVTSDDRKHLLPYPPLPTKPQPRPEGHNSDAAPPVATLDADPVRQVSLSKIREAARNDPDRPQGGTTPGAAQQVEKVEYALWREGLLAMRWAKDGSFGSKTVDAYAAWQRSLGYIGDDADGIPGRVSLTKLGKKYGFDVID